MSTQSANKADIGTSIAWNFARIHSTMARHESERREGWSWSNRCDGTTGRHDILGSKTRWDPRRYHIIVSQLPRPLTSKSEGHVDSSKSWRFGDGKGFYERQGTWTQIRPQLARTSFARGRDRIRGIRLCEGIAWGLPEEVPPRRSQGILSATLLIQRNLQKPNQAGTDPYQRVRNAPELPIERDNNDLKEDEFLVECIIDKEIARGKQEYLLECRKKVPEHNV